MPEKDTLKPHEWATFFILLALMAFLAKSSLTSWPTKEGIPVPPPQEQYVITLKGALQQPGRYHFPKGTTLGEALAQVSLNEDANVSKLDLDQGLKPGQRITIPAHKKTSK